MLEQAYRTGKSTPLDVSDIQPLGDRQSWYGRVRVSQLGLGKASMAHAKALGKTIVANRLVAPYGATIFACRISPDQTLTIQRLDHEIVVDGKPKAQSASRTRPNILPGKRVSSQLATQTEKIYELIHGLPRYHGRSTNELPYNGIYLFFEAGEKVIINGRAFDRIVRVGTHRADGRFRQRIRQHYGTGAGLGHKNNSVFRKHLGGAIMRREDLNDPRLSEWLKPKGQSFGEIEKRVSDTLGNDFTFVCFDVSSAAERLDLERGLISLLAGYPPGKPSPGWLGHHAAAPAIRTSGLWNTQHIAAVPLSGAEVARLKDLIDRPAGTVKERLTNDTLIIIPCGQGKVWDRYPWLGAIPAAEAYTGAPFKVNKEYAEKFADKWVILSAKYGFIEPDFKIPETYNVTFKKKSTKPIDQLSLEKQAVRLDLYDFGEVVGLGGKEYQAVIKAVFGGKTGIRLSFPFAGLPLGLAMQAIKREVTANEAGK